MEITSSLLAEISDKVRFFLLTSFIKGNEEEEYTVIITSFVPLLKYWEKIGEKLYLVKGSLIVSEKGGMVDYKTLVFTPKERIKRVINFDVLMNADLKIIGFRLL